MYTQRTRELGAASAAWSADGLRHTAALREQHDWFQKELKRVRDEGILLAELARKEAVEPYRGELAALKEEVRGVSWGEESWLCGRQGDFAGERR